MFRLFSLAAAERGRQKRRLELSLAGICELELLKRRHEASIIRALAMHAPEAQHESARRRTDDPSPRSPTDGSWTLMKLLQHQVGELKVDADALDPVTETSSGFCEQVEGPSESSGQSEICRPVRLAERPKSAGDVFVGRESSSGIHAIPRSLSAPYPPIAEAEDEPWVWQSNEDGDEDVYRQAQRVETYIQGLIQRRSPPSRPSKPRTSLGPESRGVSRQSSTSRKEPPYAPERHKEPERHAWAEDESWDPRYGIRSTSLDLPCGAPDPSSSEAESHFYPNTHSDELVNAQYIPAQPCRAQARSTSTPKASYSPERRPRAAQKKCRFTEDKLAIKKPGRKACRAQSENSLLGQRGVAERKYNTVERDAVRNVPSKARRGSGRRWRSTLELSQDEAEAETPIRRSRKPRPVCGYTQPTAHLQQTQLRNEYSHALTHAVLGESESSLSEAESPGSSSLSSDSDESGGLVWPQQLHPQQLHPQPSHPQPKAFVKIKASHALKKKILRFRSGSLKVMTTV